MFITRFTHKDGQFEDYLYHTEQEAQNHLELFKNDDSGLYKNIAVINEQNYVLCILPFIDGVPDEIVKTGSIVRLRDEYASEEERKRNDLFVVKNMNEWSGRINITCLTSNMALKPTETVGVEMVRVVFDNDYLQK